MNIELLRVLQRRLRGKPPLVSRADRKDRRKLLNRIKRATVKIIWKLSRNYLKLKWRWCRGEIRERRIIIAHFSRMANPLRRPIDYTGMAKKAFTVEKLDPLD